MRMPPAISFLIVGSIDAGASFQIEIMSLQTKKKTTTSYLMYFHMVVDYVQNSHQYSMIVEKNYLIGKGQLRTLGSSIIYTKA